MVNFVEEGPNEFVQLDARRQKGKRATIKQFGAERFLQARDLAAYCRLLDPVWHIANGGHDSAMTGDVVEKLEMMNVHDRVIRCLPANLSIHDYAVVDAS
jgi:hypothetical protein